jgi:hypothetical protein
MISDYEILLQEYNIYSDPEENRFWNPQVTPCWDWIDEDDYDRVQNLKMLRQAVFYLITEDDFSASFQVLGFTSGEARRLKNKQFSMKFRLLDCIPENRRRPDLDEKENFLMEWLERMYEALKVKRSR